MTTLTIDHISARLGGRDILTDVTLDVPSGTRLAVVGPSGSGKSTLLRLIAGFQRAAGGEIRLDDEAVTRSDHHVPAHRRRIGFVAQDGALFPHLTAAQNIRFGLRRGEATPQRVNEAARLAGLEADLLSRYPHQLSGGQQQRVSLARALAPRPRLLLLDEPFSALDTALRASTRQSVIDALDEAAVTTVLVTHDQEEALTFGHGIAVLESGRIAQQGDPAEVYRYPATAAVGAFLGDVVRLAGTVGAATIGTALGRITIAADRRNSRNAEAVVLLRPSQFTVHTGEDHHNAFVLELVPSGPYTMTTLVIDDEQQLTIPVPDARAEALSPGQDVWLSVDGAGVIFDQG